MAHRIERSALVMRPASAMYALVADVEAYPRRFDWCRAASVMEQGQGRMKARLDLQLAGFRTWFVTENTLEAGRAMDMRLVDGPFKRLHGRWEFLPLSEAASKVSLTLEFEPASSLLAPVIRLGLQGLADRMVDDFVRTARAEAA